MQTLRSIFTTKNVLGGFLGFVMVWFGINEILSPQEWVTFVPSFVNPPMLATLSVLAHGVLLIVCGLSLFLNYYRKISATIVSLMLLEIIVNLILISGLTDIVVRDIGLFGSSLALLFN